HVLALADLLARVHDGFLDDEVARGLRDNLHRVEDRDTRREERAERSREARDRDLAKHRAHDGQSQEQAVEEPPSVLAAIDRNDRDRAADHEDDDERQPADEALGGGDDRLRDAREIVGRAEVLEDVLERRDDPAEQDEADADEDEENDGRIDHRAAKLALQLHRLFVVNGETIENRVEDAADLARLNEVAIELVEDLRVLAERVAEGRTAFDAALDVAKDAAEELVVGLVGEDVEALHDRETGVDHRREEARERDEVLLRNPGPDLERRQIDVERLLAHARRHELHRAELRLDAVLGLGLHGALAELTGRRSGFPYEF